MKYKILEIAKFFEINEAIISYKAFGGGHINDTYLCETTSHKKYVFQRINDYVFKDVDGLMNNIKLVTDFIRNKYKEEGLDYERSTLEIVPAKDGKLYYFDGKNYLRFYGFIPNSYTYDVTPTKELFYYSARAFGKFARYLVDFDATQLIETIPNFHNTKVRYNTFLEAVDNNLSGRLSLCINEVKFVKDHEELASLIVDKLASGELPYKVTHNDTKLNNVLFDNTTQKPLAVIDLDTIMPGTLAYDFGDSIRFGCNPAAEDEKDLSKVYFDLELFEEYTKGYFKSLKGCISKIEAETLALGAKMMTFECGMRFLTDYLDGDLYFRTIRDEQNLDRARTQFKLLTDMEKIFDKMNEIVNYYYENGVE